MHPEPLIIHPWARCGLSLFLGFLASCAPTPNQAPAKLRHDGVYAGGDYPYGCVENGNLLEYYLESWDLLRFYPDGTVIEETNTLFVKPSTSEKYMAKENPRATRRGHYSLRGNRISFVTMEPGAEDSRSIANDPIYSSGKIEGDGLILRRHRPESKASGWIKRIFGESVKYRFTPY